MTTPSVSSRNTSITLSRGEQRQIQDQLEQDGLAVEKAAIDLHKEIFAAERGLSGLSGLELESKKAEIEAMKARHKHLQMVSAGVEARTHAVSDGVVTERELEGLEQLSKTIGASERVVEMSEQAAAEIQERVAAADPNLKAEVTANRVSQGRRGEGRPVNALQNEQGETSGYGVTVKKGDTLSRIAAEHGIKYGSPEWTSLLEANKDSLARNGVFDPNKIFPGQTVIIPAAIATAAVRERAAQGAASAGTSAATSGATSGGTSGGTSTGTSGATSGASASSAAAVGTGAAIAGTAAAGTAAALVDGQGATAEVAPQVGGAPTTMMAAHGIMKYHGKELFKFGAAGQVGNAIRTRVFGGHGLREGADKLRKATPAEIAEANKLRGASGRFKPENPAELKRVQELNKLDLTPADKLRKATAAEIAEANNLRGASGRFKPENPAELKRVQELNKLDLTPKAQRLGDSAVDMAKAATAKGTEIAKVATAKGSELAQAATAKGAQLAETGGAVAKKVTLNLDAGMQATLTGIRKWRDTGDFTKATSSFKHSLSSRLSNIERGTNGATLFQKGADKLAKTDIAKSTMKVGGEALETGRAAISSTKGVVANAVEGGKSALESGKAALESGKSTALAQGNKIMANGKQLLEGAKSSAIVEKGASALKTATTAGSSAMATAANVGTKAVEAGGAALKVGKGAIAGTGRALGSVIPGVGTALGVGMTVLDSKEASRIQNDPNASATKKVLGWATAGLSGLSCIPVVGAVPAVLSIGTGLIRDKVK